MIGVFVWTMIIESLIGGLFNAARPYLPYTAATALAGTRSLGIRPSRGVVGVSTCRPGGRAAAGYRGGSAIAARPRSAGSQLTAAGADDHRGTVTSTLHVAAAVRGGAFLAQLAGGDAGRPKRANTAAGSTCSSSSTKAVTALIFPSAGERVSTSMTAGSYAPVAGEYR